MKIFVIFATLVVCTYAAPFSELPHPSPVNPNVLVEQKPAERIILIADPKEMAKFKRETLQPLYPTVLPLVENNHHLRAQREDQRDTQTKSKDPLSLQNPQLSYKQIANERNCREVEPVKVSQTLPAVNSGHFVLKVYQKPQILPATEKPIPQTSEAVSKKPNQHYDKSEQPDVTTEKSSKSQGLPVIFSPSKIQKRNVLKPSVSTIHHLEDVPQGKSSEKLKLEFKKEELTNDKVLKSHYQHKRDIPVPLVPKHHHSKELLEEDKVEENIKTSNYKQEHESFQKPQVLPEILKKPGKEVHQHKRDVPVPIVAKQHHPEGYLKDNKEERKTESQEHVIKEGFIKTQFLPETIETQKHTRDILLPCIAKHDHQEKPIKNGDEKDTNLNGHHDSHQLPHSEKSFTHDGLQKPQLPSAILKEKSSETLKHKRDIPVPLVPKHPHPEESPNNEYSDKEVHADKTKLNTGIHNSEHGIQKLQTLPEILKESPIETQHKRNVSPNDSRTEVNKEIHVQEEIQKSQTLPSTSTFSSDQQRKSDAIVPVAENHNHQEELLEVNHHLAQTQQISQTFPAHNNNIPNVHNQQHILPQPQINSERQVDTIPIIHKFQPNQHNEYTHHFHQRLTSENHEHVTQNTQPDFNLEDMVPMNSQNTHIQEHMPHNLQNSQVLTNHPQEHVKPTNFQEPQILPALSSHLEKAESIPAVSKKTTESMAQEKRDALLSAESAEQSHKHEVAKKYKKQEIHPTPDELQVEDLLEPQPLLESHLHHTQLTHSEHKPNILDDHLSSHYLPGSTTEHPVIRNRPVPVAELFARVHDN